MTILFQQKTLDEINKFLVDVSSQVKEVDKFSDTEEAIMDTMCGSILRHLFQDRIEAKDIDTIRCIAQYLREEEKTLCAISDEAAILNGNVEFSPVPFSVSKEQEMTIKVIENWRQLHAIDGRQYYWNTKTNEVLWTAPSEIMNYFNRLDEDRKKSLVTATEGNTGRKSEPFKDMFGKAIKKQESKGK